MDDSVFIPGFGFGNFASFGDIQYIAPCKKMNIIIGQNNTGKSNILRFLSDHSEKYLEAAILEAPFPNTEPHQSEISFNNNHVFALYINIQAKTFQSVYKRTPNISKEKLNEFHTKILDIISSRIQFLQNGSFDLQYKNNFLNYYHENWSEIDALFEGVGKYRRDCDNPSIDVSGSKIFNELLDDYRNIITAYPPKITLIHSVREIGDGALIEKLASMDRPKCNEFQKTLEQKFNNLKQFIREITGDDNADIKIPCDKETINVIMNNKSLRIDQLGRGITEVVILAFHITALENQVICIDEPELHLHPTTQKKLIRYLIEKTNNQYFIATHSPHFLDTPDAEIFHVTLDKGQSIVTRITDDSGKFNICRDLGFKASDLLQSNCIIWVEGPSDRIYLNYWIQSKKPDFKEGLHYSIMPYGGRLLSHLSGTEYYEPEQDVEDFIALHKLNRNMAILIDSDFKKEDDKLNPTKKRVQQEFYGNGSFVWITAGKEIENYIEPNILKKAIQSVHPNVKYGKFEKFLSCLELTRVDTRKKISPEKVPIAREVVALNPDLSRFDLDEQINRLIAFIKSSNHISPTSKAL